VLPTTIAFKDPAATPHPTLVKISLGATDSGIWFNDGSSEKIKVWAGAAVCQEPQPVWPQPTGSVTFEEAIAGATVWDNSDDGGAVCAP
jgi:hypothetical protein